MEISEDDPHFKAKRERVEIPNLSPPWKAYLHHGYLRVFYFNPITKESTWTFPKSESPPETGIDGETSKGSRKRGSEFPETKNLENLKAKRQTELNMESMNEQLPNDLAPASNALRCLGCAIFDTCALISCPELPSVSIHKNIICVIPYTTLRELDGLKNVSSVKDKAIQAISIIEKLTRGLNPFIELETSAQSVEMIEGFIAVKNDDFVLKCSLRVQHEVVSNKILEASSVVFVTNDKNLSIAGRAHGLVCINHEDYLSNIGENPNVFRKKKKKPVKSANSETVNSERTAEDIEEEERRRQMFIEAAAIAAVREGVMSEVRKQIEKWKSTFVSPVNTSTLFTKPSGSDEAFTVRPIRPRSTPTILATDFANDVEMQDVAEIPKVESMSEESCVEMMQIGNPSQEVPMDCRPSIQMPMDCRPSRPASVANRTLPLPRSRTPEELIIRPISTLDKDQAKKEFPDVHRPQKKRNSQSAAPSSRNNRQSSERQSSNPKQNNNNPSPKLAYGEYRPPSRPASNPQRYTPPPNQMNRNDRSRHYNQPQRYTPQPNQMNDRSGQYDRSHYFNKDYYEKPNQQKPNGYSGYPQQNQPARQQSSKKPKKNPLAFLEHAPGSSIKPIGKSVKNKVVVASSKSKESKSSSMKTKSSKTSSHTSAVKFRTMVRTVLKRLDKYVSDKTHEKHQSSVSDSKMLCAKIDSFFLANNDNCKAAFIELANVIRQLYAKYTKEEYNSIPTIIYDNDELYDKVAKGDLASFVDRFRIFSTEHKRTLV